MSGEAIAKEVRAALGFASKEVGSGVFTLTLLRPAAQPADPWGAPASAPAEIHLFGMVESFSQSLVDEALIKAGDKKVFLDATDVIPTTSDTIVLPDGTYAILSVDPYAPAGVALYHRLHCRR